MRKLGVSLALSVALLACGKQSPAPTGGTGGGDSGSAAPAASDAGGAAQANNGTINPNAPTSGTIKIVSSLPRTGSANAQTTTMVNGIKLAITERGNKAGNFTIVYEDWDDASAKKGDWDPEVEAANADKAVKDPDIMVYIGTYNSGAAKISMPVLNRAGLTMISPANTYTGLTKPGMGEPNEPDVYRPSGRITYFRVVPADDMQGRAGANWMKEMGGQKVYILDDRGLYGKGLADVFNVTADAIGLQVVGRDGIDPKAQEYRSLMTKVKAGSPDWIYFGGTTQTNAGQIAKDIVEVGLDAKLMVPDGCFENAFISAAGVENVNGRAFITFGGVPPEKLTGKGAEFVAKYHQTYGADPEAYAVYGYVAAQTALDAIEKSGVKDREAIRQAVAAYKQEDGPLGTWSFDKNGDTTAATLSGNTVTDGKFAFVKILTATAAPDEDDDE